jgi:hypothetical protein
VSCEFKSWQGSFCRLNLAPWCLCLKDQQAVQNRDEAARGAGQEQGRERLQLSLQVQATTSMLSTIAESCSRQRVG